MSRSTTIAILALGCALTGCVPDSTARPPTHGTSRQGPLVGALAHAAPTPRRWAAQLSTPVRFAPCDRPGLDSLRDLACADSAPRNLASLRDVAARIARADLARLDADGLHAAALLDLITADPARNATDRPISYLEMISRTAPPDVDVLADLSAAYLARAARTQDGADVVRAVDAAARAVELDSRASNARFNYALALQAMALDAQADSAWGAYLAIDSTSRWAEEARRRRAATRLPVERPAAERTDEDLRSFARRVPEQALLFAWDTLFADWSAAVARKDTMGADNAVRRAEVVGGVLASEGDSTTIDAVQAIRAATPAQRERLARAHAAYARGDLEFRTNRYASADSAFSVALAAKPSGSLLGWAEFGRANTFLNLGRSTESQNALTDLLTRAEPSRFQAIEGRVRWTLAVIRLRHGEWTSGIDGARRAASIFAGIGQRQNQAAMIALEAEARLTAGDYFAGVGGLVDAIRMSRQYVGSVSRHNALTLLMNAASAEELARAARAVDDEDAAGLERSGTSMSLAGALIGRLNRLLTSHRVELARATDARLSSAMAGVPSSPLRDRLEKRRALVRARLAMETGVAGARRMLDSAVAEFAATKEDALLLDALLERARAESLDGDARASYADFGRALDIYVSAKRAFATETASLRAEARVVTDSLVAARLRANDASGALEVLDRWHSAFAPGDFQRANVVATVQPTLVEHLLGDTLFAWVKVGPAVHLARTFVPRETLGAAVDRATLLLEHSAPRESWQPELARLYDWLIRPVADQLGPDGAEVRIVPEDVAAAAPYAALFDGARYFVERHAIVVADNMTPRMTGRRTAVAAQHPVIVANPAQTAFPALRRLAFADSEAEWVSHQYAHPLLLRGADADSARVMKALIGATLFHFAGHAVFDESRPERSALAVGANGLTAHAIAGMRLPHLDLAVLSACDVMRGAVRSEGAANGLTAAFLGAGARGVVGALWGVDDAAALPLIREFYTRYATSGDPADALRAAQVSAVADPPSTWGAFRYAER